MIGHDYLSRNRVLAARFAGKRLSRVQRMSFEPPSADPRRDPEHVLVESADGIGWLIDVDEGRRNVVLFDATANDSDAWQTVHAGERPHAIVTGEPDDPLAFVLAEPVREAAIVSREPPPHFPAGYEACGVRLDFGDDRAILIGTHLTPAPVVGVWLVLPDEADPALRYATVARVLA